MEKKLRHFPWPVRVRFGHFFQICKIPLLSILKRQAKCLKFSIHSCVDLCENALVAKRVALLMACKGTYKWNFTNTKKVAESWGSQDSCTFLDLQNSTCKRDFATFSDFFWNSTFKYTERALKVSPIFWSRICFLLTSGRLGLIIPLQGLQVWNPNMKHTTHTGPDSHPTSHWSIGNHFGV